MYPLECNCRLIPTYRQRTASLPENRCQPFTFFLHWALESLYIARWAAFSAVQNKRYKVKKKQLRPDLGFNRNCKWFCSVGFQPSAFQADGRSGKTTGTAQILLSGEVPDCGKTNNTLKCEILPFVIGYNLPRHVLCCPMWQISPCLAQTVAKEKKETENKTKKTLEMI